MSEMRGYTPDQIVEALPHISLGQVHAALSYYFDHQAEIQRELQEDRDLVREIRSRLGPSVLESRLKSVMDPTGDSISS